MTEQFREQRFTVGETVFEQDDPGHALFILREGRLGVFENDVRLATIDQPGSFVGELAYLTGSRRMAQVRAETDCVVEVVEDADAFFRERPERGLELARLLAVRLHDMTQRFLALRRELVEAGVDPDSEELTDLPQELDFVRRYLKGWRMHI